MNTLEANRIYSDKTCPICLGRGLYRPADPQCQSCKGAGWLFETDEEGDESVFECQCTASARLRHCECHTRMKINAMTEKARIPAKNITCRVSTYTPSTAGEKMVKRQVESWFENFPNSTAKPGLILIGEPGTGKTHLATALCNALIRLKSIQPLYASCTEMMAKATARIDDKTLPDPFAYPAQVTVLVLDDLGAERPSEWGLNMFAELIDLRYRNAMPTIITSNLAMTGIEDIYGPRIADRIYEMCQILICDGPSRRRPSEVVGV